MLCARGQCGAFASRPCTLGRAVCGPLCGGQKRRAHQCNGQWLWGCEAPRANRPRRCRTVVGLASTTVQRRSERCCTQGSMRSGVPSSRRPPRWRVRAWLRSWLGPSTARHAQAPNAAHQAPLFRRSAAAEYAVFALVPAARCAALAAGALRRRPCVRELDESDLRRFRISRQRSGRLLRGRVPDCCAPREAHPRRASANRPRFRTLPARRPRASAVGVVLDAAPEARRLGSTLRACCANAMWAGWTPSTTVDPRCS